MTKHSKSSLSPFQSTGQDLNSMLGLVNIVDSAADALGVDAPTRKQVKTGLVVSVLVIGAIMLYKKLS